MSGCARIKQGDKVRIVNTTAGHGLPIGHETTVEYITNEWGDGTRYYLPRGCFARPDDLVKVCDDTTAEGVAEGLEAARKKVEDLEDRLDYLKATGQDSFCEKEYKVYRALQAIERHEDIRDRARVIAELIG